MFQGPSSSDKIMKIYLMRHGQTSGDVEDRYGGDYEDHLTDLGRKQSRQLAQEMKDKGIEIVYVSPRIRAQEVAQILSPTINCPIETVADWRERNNYGILSGMKKSEAREKHPKLVELLRDRNNTIEGGESYVDFKTRIIKVFNDLINSHHNTMAIITHAGPMRVIYREILKLGEIDKIGDCAWFELEVLGSKINILQQKGIEIPKNSRSDFSAKHSNPTG